MTERRPWGSFEVLAEGDGYKVKRIIVDPGEATSLQYHEHRAEWMFLIRSQMVHMYQPGEPHRLENNGIEPLEVIEVQLGDILDEDDIVRLDDRYGRA